MVQIDRNEIEKRMNSAKSSNEASSLKEKAKIEGYVHSLSLYGVLTNSETGKSEYRRIEVLSNVFWTGEIIELIYRWFQTVKPSKTYTIWQYNKDLAAIRQIGAYE